MSRGLVAALLVSMTAPCLGQTSSQSSGTAGCSEAAARFAIGQTYSDELAERARQASGARLARRIEPGGAYTMELRPDRLNIEIDRGGVVQQLRCG